MRYALSVLSLALLTTHAVAQQGYSAKSLFFGEDNAVVAVATGPAASSAAVAEVANAQAASAATTTAADSANGEQAAPVTVAAQSGDGNAVTRVVLKKPKHSRSLGASYFIRLKDRDGATHDVLANRLFHSGERFQLGIKVNRPAYVYILNEAPDGAITQIYPQPSQDNFVDAMGVVFFPGKGSFEFDSKPGVEQLLVFLSPEPARGDMEQRIRTLQPDLISAPAGALHTADNVACPVTPITPVTTAAQDPNTVIQVADAGPGYASKGIAFKDDVPAGCAAANTSASDQGYAAKGIVFSDDAQPDAGGQVASYVVKRTSTTQANLYLKIRLVHE